MQTGPVCITQRWSAVDKSVCSSARLKLILSSQCLPAPRPQRSSFPNPKERPRLPRKPMRDGTVNSWGTSRSHFGDCFTNGIAGCDTSRTPSNASGEVMLFPMKQLPSNSRRSGDGYGLSGLQLCYLPRERVAHTPPVLAPSSQNASPRRRRHAWIVLPSARRQGHAPCESHDLQDSDNPREIR